MIDIPIRVKDALKAGSYRKNWRMIVLPNAEDPEGFVIENDSIVKESVMIDERMCSGKQLKFGLCEGSSLEFQYFDHPNIQGRRIEAILEAEYEDADKILKWYQIPMGFFDVDACPMQFSTGIRKVTAFNKLKSDYLDEKANTKLMESYDDPNAEITFRDIRTTLLDGYEVEEKTYSEIIPEASTSVANYTRKAGSNSSVVFASKTGIDSPWNYFEYAGLDSLATTVYPFVACYSVTAELDENKAYKLLFKYDIEAFEQMYYDRIKDLADKSFTMSGETFVENMFNANTSTGTYFDKYDGWTDFFGVTIEKSNGNIENYSTLAYARKKNYAKGSLKDLEKITLINCKKIIIKIPRFIHFDQNNAYTGDRFLNFYFWGNLKYRYLVTMSTTVESSYNWTAPDGSTTDMQWAMHGWYELREYPNISKADKTIVKVGNLPDITLREATSAVYELSAQFGKLDRETDLFSGVTLNHDRLLPADSLYPSDDLLPRSRSERSDPSAYEKLWTDSGQAYRFKDLIITYKAEENGQAVEKNLQRTINTHGNVNYNMSSNWLFKNLIWTADQIGEYADDMVEKLRDVSWIPFEMWCAGMPWIETGDEIEISNKEGTFTSYILSRQLKGIQDLHDTYINGELDIF